MSATIASLNFYALCEIASYLLPFEFKRFVCTCRQFSACRNDVRTVAQVFINEAPNNRNQWLTSIAARKLTYGEQLAMPVLIYIARHLGYADNDKLRDSVLINDVAGDNLIDVFDQLLSQDQKFAYLLYYCGVTLLYPPHFRPTFAKHSEVVSCMRELLLLWELSHETLAKLVSDIEELKLGREPDSLFYAPLRFLCDGTIMPDERSQEYLVEYLIESNRVEDLLAVIPRISEPLRTSYLLNEMRLFQYFIKDVDKHSIRMCLYESLSNSLSDENRAEALLFAAIYNNDALVERIFEDMQEQVAIKSLISDSIKFARIDIYDRYIDRWHPSASEITALTSVLVELFGSIEGYAHERLIDVYLGDTADGNDSPWIRIAADLMHRDYVDRKSLLTQFVELRRHVKPSAGKEDPIERLFKAVTAVYEIEALALFKFRQQTVDEAFVNLCQNENDEEESQRDVLVFEAFIKHHTPSEFALLDGIWELHQSGGFEVLDWLRDKRYFLVDKSNKTQISKQQFDERRTRQANTYTMDYLLLNATRCGQKVGCARIKSLLDQEHAPSQEIINEAFRAVAGRKSLEWVKTFLTLPKNRPSIDLVRELIPPKHSLHHLVEIKI